MVAPPMAATRACFSGGNGGGAARRPGTEVGVADGEAMREQHGGRGQRWGWRDGEAMRGRRRRLGRLVMAAVVG
jgi:hypothetical protein